MHVIWWWLSLVCTVSSTTLLLLSIRQHRRIPSRYWRRMIVFTLVATLWCGGWLAWHLFGWG